MGTAPRHRTRRPGIRRAGTAGFVLALSAALVFPGMATAAPGPDPLIVNDCDATVKGEPGKPATLDVGAILEAPGILTIGLGNESEGTNGNEQPLVVLPVKEGVDTLGLSGAPVVRDVTGETCGVVKDAGNATAAVVQEINPVDDLVTGPDEQEPEEPGPAPEPTPPAPGIPGNPEDPAPGEGGNAPGLTDPGSIGAGLGATNDPFVPAGRFQALGPITVPPLAGLPPVQAPPQAPDLNAPNAEQQPDALAENSGTAEAIPESDPPERLPLLLAVLAVVIVAALLARTWIRARKTA
ncbi:hypothetical protein [Amycolatopsis marina]|nr:hypothetical protein [Amycolatopsis marina]